MGVAMSTLYDCETQLQIEKQFFENEYYSNNYKDRKIRYQD